MSFFKFLQGVGDRLGILETVPDPDALPTVRIQTRVVTLRELTSEIRSSELSILADSPAELAVPFEKIFETAGISSDPGDWTIDRLKQLVATEPFKNKPLEEVRRSVLDRLNAEGVPAERIVKDAMARDQALDAFEASVREKMQERVAACRRTLLEIESQIRSLNEEKAELEEKLRADEEKWREWKRNKRACERELASAASYIVDHPVITTENDDAG
jgi:hypothetical protein